MPAGIPYTPIGGGFYVPAERMLEILDQLASKSILGTNAPLGR